MIFGVALLVWMAFVLKRIQEERRQAKALLSVMDNLGMDAAEREDFLEIGQGLKPEELSEVLKSLREYDTFVEQKMKSLFGECSPWSSKMEIVDRFYSIRRKILQKEGAVEENG